MFVCEGGQRSIGNERMVGWGGCSYTNLTYWFYTAAPTGVFLLTKSVFFYRGSLLNPISLFSGPPINSSF
jgi:hypothetical protein